MTRSPPEGKSPAPVPSLYQAVESDKIRLIEGLRQNEVLVECLSRLADLSLPDWYLGAGCVSQTLWNLAHGEAPTSHIRDYDFTYFDSDLSAEAERSIENSLREKVADLPLVLDVTNQARVHLWYPDRFGYEIAPYTSLEESVTTWPTTATAVGVRLEDGEMEVYSPFGPGDLLNLIVRANRVQVTRDIFEEKAARWEGVWPSLSIIPWEMGVGAEGDRITRPRGSGHVRR